MESLSRPPQRRKHSAARSASTSSFSLNNPYGDVLLSRGADKAKFQPHEYAEIFSGSTSIPVLDLSGLTQPAGFRSSELDYSNIFGGAKGGDVAVCHEQLFNGVVKTNKTRRIPADAESPFQEHGSLNASGKAKSSLGANGLPVDGIKQQFNVSFNKISQRSSNESNGKTHIAQLQAVPGFTHFVDDGTPQSQKKEGERPVLLVKREVSRTWSFNSGIDATIIKGGLSSEKSHTPDKSCLPSFASNETAGENSPPLFDEELDENSDAAVSIAALKKAIEQAQESMRLAKLIMQKKREGIKDGSRARRSKGRSKVEDKKETRTEHASGGPKENNVMGKNQRLNPTFPVFTGVDGKSAPILSHSDNLLNARKTDVETVRENFEPANAHGDAFIDVDKKFTSSCSRSGSCNTDIKDELENIMQNVGASESHGETTNYTGSVETVVLESGKLDCNDNSVCSTTKAVPCLDHMETGHEALEQRESTKHQAERHEVFSRRAEGAANTSPSVQELEQSPNEEAVEQCQATVSPVKGPANLVERVLIVSGSTQEHGKITHGGGHSRINQENELTEGSGGIADKEMCEMKFVGNEELYLTEKNMVDEADIGKQRENVSEWQEDGQDAKCSDGGEIGLVAKEEILWFESEVQLEEPGIFPVVGEAATEMCMVLKPEIDDERPNFEEDIQTVSGEYEDYGIAIRPMDAAESEAIETIQIGTNTDSEAQNGRIPLDVEELNHTDGAAGRRNHLQDNGQELNDSASERDTSEAFAVHSNDRGAISSDNHGINTTTFFSETPEPCNVDFNNKAGEHQALLRGCEDNYSLPRGTDIFWEVEENEAGKQFELEPNNMPGTDIFGACASAEKCTESQLNNTYKRFSSDSKSTSDVLTYKDHEKTLPNNEDMLKTATEIHNTAQEYAANINMQNFLEGHVCTANQVQGIDNTDVKPDLRQNSENSEESQSTYSVESEDEVSAHESPACRNDAKEDSLNKEEITGDLDMKSDERVHAGLRSEWLNSKDQSHLSQTNCKPKEMDESVEAERNIKTGQDMEENVQNLGRTSISEKPDAKQNEQKCEIDSWQRIEAIRRGREQEKDRIARLISEWVNSEDQSHLSQTNCKSKEIDKSVEAERNIKTGQDMEENVQNLGRTSTPEKPDAKLNEQKCEIDSWQRIEAIRRGGEQEKDRIARLVSEWVNSKDQSHLSQTNCKPKEMDKSVEAERDIKTGQDMEENVQNLGRTSASEKQDSKRNEQKYERDSWQRIEAIRRGREQEKDRIAVEREREKDRIAVDRAIREVRERAFAEARERAERAAVEKAAAEAQQRVTGQVREKTVKASVDTKPSVDKASIEAKLRVERAAVERATAEARERALEKAMSQKTSMGARGHAAKYSAERPSSSSRNDGLKHSFSYSDLEKSDGATSESAQRRKARLERHQRIMERAAKALAEKNTRDLLAQKEQAERSRLAESLDADIKRWATGKEGNLRALLSTLQYILGPESAWQPVSLTEIVTAAAVKKAYRKATLCVHPDKLQQRGASIQQKYICEKIFDLLKAAWNRFNSEEN
ncbi:auxilin-like protein 1 isoform X1 [Salvia miltiorrhiza]|uniref:auxilin-like protein 1 isoform X1 n=1 Tax=Salvia miltiorrhiza TaxID=226208 RepID=UPI0025AC978A|nr:auxilin-like protein 1 isoform X1 [Salvia miltiorrhiza]